MVNKPPATGAFFFCTQRTSLHHDYTMATTMQATATTTAAVQTSMQPNCCTAYRPTFFPLQLRLQERKNALPLWWRLA